MSCVKYWPTSGNAQIKNSQYEKLFGVTTDMKLNFKKHIQPIYEKARAKLKV